LLSPHIDHLFDKGYITFTDEGQLIASPGLPAEILSAWGISPINVGKFTDNQKVYLAYHRNEIFRSGNQ